MRGAGFSELCSNYLQERLQLLAHQRTITDLKERLVNMGCLFFFHVDKRPIAGW